VGQSEKSHRAEERRLAAAPITAEAEDRGFPPAHPLAIDSGADAAGCQDLCGVREWLAKESTARFRLMGTASARCVPALRPTTATWLDRRSAHAERPIDDLRKKFGNAAVIRGIAYQGRRRMTRRRSNLRSKSFRAQRLVRRSVSPQAAGSFQEVYTATQCKHADERATGIAVRNRARKPNAQLRRKCFMRDARVGKAGVGALKVQNVR